MSYTHCSTLIDILKCSEFFTYIITYYTSLFQCTKSNSHAKEISGLSITNEFSNVEFEALTEITMKNTIFWDMMPYSLVESTGLHGITS
jgi:hypothetical protein